MQKINMTSSSSSSAGHTNTTTKLEGDHHQHQHQLPGFRFHPTDEELVGFYLRRKVDRKLPVTRIIDNLIKHIDIYKFDPWDLPNAINGGDKECYFFCKRGRKYKNSIRPNRVTGSGFWKATGIDKPVYSLDGDQIREHHCIIGLKKTLVYYRGFAGKGTKTDWMMHEFRLPSDNSTVEKNNATTQEAEVWTVCKIFKRNASYKKYTPVGVGGWRSLEHASSGSGKQVCVDLNSSQICNTTTTDQSSNNTLIIMNSLKEEAARNYISFSTPQPPSSSSSPCALFQDYNEKKPSVMPISTMPTTIMSSIHSIANYHCFEETRNNNNLNHLNSYQTPNNNVVSAAASSSSCCNISGPDNTAAMMDQHFTYENWDELRSVVEFALDHQSQSPHHHHGCGPL